MSQSFIKKPDTGPHSALGTLDLHGKALRLAGMAEAREATLRGQLGAAVALLRECLGPLEVSAAVIESEDGGEAIETLIAQVRKFCADAATCGVLASDGDSFPQETLMPSGKGNP